MLLFEELFRDKYSKAVKQVEVDDGLYLFRKPVNVDIRVTIDGTYVASYAGSNEYDFFGFGDTELRAIERMFAKTYVGAHNPDSFIRISR